MEQVHCDEIEIVDEVKDKIYKCYALMTNQKNTVICVMVADCSPILIYDKKIMPLLVCMLVGLEFAKI